MIQVYFHLRNIIAVFIAFSCYCLSAQDDIPDRIGQHVYSDSVDCKQLFQIINNEADSVSVSELAHLYYQLGFSSNCCRNGKIDKYSYLKKAKIYWDSTQYRGYRYINILAEYIDEYSSENKTDSLKKYFKLIDDVPKINNVDFISVYRFALLTYVYNLSGIGDNYKAIDLIEGCINNQFFNYWSEQEKGKLYFDLAQLYIELDFDVGYDKSEEYSFLAIKYFNSAKNKNGVLQSQYNLARIYELTRKEENYDVALTYYVNNYNNARLNKSTNEYITFANAIGEFYYKTNRINRAKDWFNKAISYIQERGQKVAFSSSPFLHLAKIRLKDNNVISANELIQFGLGYVLQSDFDIHNPRYLSEKDIIYPIEAIRLLNVLAKSHAQNPQFQNEGSESERSLEILSIAFDLFHNMIKHAEVNESKYTQKRIFNELFKQMIDQALLLSDPEQLFTITDKIKHSLLRYDLGGNLVDSVSTVDSIPSMKNDEESLAIIQYGFSSDSLFAVVKENGAYHTHILAQIDSIKSIIEMGKRLIRYPSSPSDLNPVLRQLYQTLVEPLSIQSETIRIIYDEELANLPFGAFMTNSTDQFPFLINEKIIHYQYSQSLFNKIRDRQYWNKGIGTAAPFFDKNPDKDYSGIRGANGSMITLHHLQYAQEEVGFISNLWDTPVINPIKDELIHSFLNNEVTHFSGHAISISDKPEESFLALGSDMSNTDNKLTLAEIYKMSCKNDMVVLSACETGTGSLAQSEGILSIARGFFFAGAKSIISTLWSVEDKSTSDIVKHFYKHLHSGHPKDVALQNAKINYLEDMQQTDPSKTHPYYWSSLVAVGDMSPLKSPSRIKYLVTVGSLFLFVFTFLLYSKRK